jgi:hypothetical protein
VETVHASCAADPRRLRFKNDGVDYRLDPMPIEACLAAFERSAARVNLKRLSIQPNRKAL